MSSSIDLTLLAQNRDALLLAEVAALLHDMGKCADEHIINQASNKPSGYSYRYKTAQSHRLPVGLANINLLVETVLVQTLIEQGMPRVINNTSQSWLLRVLGKCHAVAQGIQAKGQIESIVRRETLESHAFGSRLTNGVICWAPGSVLESASVFEISKTGIWRGISQ